MFKNWKKGTEPKVGDDFKLNGITCVVTATNLEDSPDGTTGEEGQIGKEGISYFSVGDIVRLKVDDGEVVTEPAIGKRANCDLKNIIKYTKYVITDKANYRGEWWIRGKDFVSHSVKEEELVLIEE